MVWSKHSGKIAGIICLLLVLGGCRRADFAPQAGKTREEAFSKTDFVMDTVLQMTVYGKKDVTDDIKNSLAAAETKQLSWREADSEVSVINEKCGKGQTVAMEKDFSGWVRESLVLSEKSGGAFDPTIGRLTRLWNIEGDHPVVPEQSAIEERLKEMGYTHINIEESPSDDEKDTISMDEGVTLDLGAVGKGIGCDMAKQVLDEDGDTSGAVAAIGGSILTYGAKPDGESWKVAIRDPKGAEGEYMGVINIEGTAFVSTSGDYEKYFVENGKKYHHILDPATGYPAESGLCSVTIVCVPGQTEGEYPGLLSDGLSTACFILGREKGEALLKEYGAEGVFVDTEGNVTVTEGLKEKFEKM